MIVNEADVEGSDDSGDEQVTAMDEDDRAFVDDGGTPSRWQPGLARRLEVLSSPIFSSDGDEEERTAVPMYDSILGSVRPPTSSPPPPSPSPSSSEEEEEARMSPVRTHQVPRRRDEEEAIRSQRQFNIEGAGGPVASTSAAATTSSMGITTSNNQCVIDRTTWVESPVNDAVPGRSTSHVHQMMVVTIPVSCFEDPATHLMRFPERAPFAKEFERVIVLMSRMVRMAGIAHPMPAEDSAAPPPPPPTTTATITNTTEEITTPFTIAAAASSTTSSRGRGRGGAAAAAAQPVYTVSGSEELLKTYTYMEMLSAEPRPGSSSVEGEPEVHKFCGVRLFLFLMDSRLDLGRLMHSCLLSSIPVAALQRMSDPLKRLLPRNKNELLQELYRVYLDVTTISPQRSGCNISLQLQRLERSEHLTRVNIQRPADDFHPHRFFTLNRSMEMYTTEVRRAQRTMDRYECEGGGSFAGFPFPDLVTYIPPTTFGDVALVRMIPILNSYMRRHAERQTARGRTLLGTAMVDDTLGMTDGMVRLPPPSRRGGHRRTHPSSMA